MSKFFWMTVSLVVGLPMFGSFLIGGVGNKVALLGVIGLPVSPLFMLRGIIGVTLVHTLSKHAPAVTIRLLNRMPVV